MKDTEAQHDSPFVLQSELMEVVGLVLANSDLRPGQFSLPAQI
jgi:hypothetical protein